LRFAILNCGLIYQTIVSFVEDRDRRAMSLLSRIHVGKETSGGGDDMIEANEGLYRESLLFDQGG